MPGQLLKNYQTFSLIVRPCEVTNKKLSPFKEVRSPSTIFFQIVCEQNARDFGLRGRRAQKGGS